MTWTGNSLVVTSSPNLGAGANVLVGMMARTSTDVWAVGFGSGQAMALHQDGLGWSLIDTTSLAGNSALYAVQSMATDDAWAVGIRNGHTLTAHWNGSSWSVVPSPQPSMIRDELYGLSGTGTSDLWAVGSLSDTQSSDQTLALHWNGSTWAIVPSPSKGTSYNYLKAVVAFAADTATAVGDYVDSTTHDYQPLIEQASENQQFNDVPGISPFYGYIHSLACRSILGGYTTSPPCPAGAAPCLPGANVTAARSQDPRQCRRAGRRHPLDPTDLRGCADQQPFLALYRAAGLAGARLHQRLPIRIDGDRLHRHRPLRPACHRDPAVRFELPRLRLRNRDGDAPINPVHGVERDRWR